ncbi:EH domain-containing protein 1 [Dirofilaria immitis]|nr:EH domain-containing protein 1 [Dirofilaria immitis]
MCKPGEQPLPDPAIVGAMQALKAAYDRKVVPSEKRYLYSEFDTPPLSEQEFMGKPTILLLGQYSVGKTSMISYLLNGNYPGADIGPEPTTDILRMATRFNAPLLKHISIIDTPGILTGDKQVENRGYDFAQVIKFLSSKVDCIFLLFDANKLDISDEYKQVIQILEGSEDKIKIILNKADWVRPRELVHVRGALMWALGKIMRCPEVPKEDLAAVVQEIADLPNSYHRKRINDVAKRARNTKAKDWARIDYKLEKLLNSFIENDIALIANAAINEKECKIKFRVPKKYHFQRSIV